MAGFIEFRQPFLVYIGIAQKSFWLSVKDSFLLTKHDLVESIRKC